MTKKLLSVLLVLCMVLSLAPAAFAAEGDDIAVAEGSKYFTDQYHDPDVDLNTLEITPITQEEVDALVAALDALLADESATDEAVEAAFKAIADAYTTAFTNYELLYFHSCMDVYDSELVSQTAGYYELGVATADQLALAARNILGTSHAEYFTEAEKLSEDDVTFYLEYEPMTDEEKALSSEMQAIEPEYNEALASGFPVTYEGTEYTFDSLDAAYTEGTVDDDTYDTVYDLLYDAYMEGLGGIYLKMLDVGRRIASSQDYENYAEYGYPNEYGRDYTIDEINAYFDAVKEYIAPLSVQIEQIYENDFYSSSDEVQALYTGDYTGDDTLDVIESYIDQLSPELGESFRYMREHNLYDIKAGETKDSGAFTYMLDAYGAPYMFSSPNGWMADFSTIVHEFGHYNNFYWHPCGWNDASANTDISEVHSQGLELLFTQFYDDIFGEEGGKLAEDVLMSSLVTYAIIYGAFFGELEIYTHSTPDVTYEDICNKFDELSQEYMLAEPMDWQTLPHLTTSPLYYVSYSVSAAGAATFWLEAQETSYDAALDEYLRFVALDPSMGFQEQFEALGLPNPLSAEFLQQLAVDLAEALDVESRVNPQLFNDVTADNEYYDFITYLGLRGGINGDENGNFNPDDNADRAQVIQMLYNIFARKGEENDNPLTDIDGKWYEDAAAWAYTRNVTTGFTDPVSGKLLFGGENVLDWQTMSVLFCRMLKLFGVSDCVPTASADYADADLIADWARDSVDFLYENGFIDVDENNNIGPNVPVTRAETAVMIYYLSAIVNG